MYTRQTENIQQFDVRTAKKPMCISMGGAKLWICIETNLKVEIGMHTVKIYRYKQAIMESYI